MKVAFLAIVCAVFVTLAKSDPYDPVRSQHLLHFSSATYCAESTLPSWSCGPACLNEPGMTNVTLISNYLEGTFGYIGVQDETIIIAFRGSYNVANWIYDLDIVMKPYPSVEGAEVHAGFYDMYVGIQA